MPKVHFTESTLGRYKEREETFTTPARPLPSWLEELQQGLQPSQSNDQLILYNTRERPVSPPPARSQPLPLYSYAIQERVHHSKHDGSSKHKSEPRHKHKHTKYLGHTLYYSVPNPDYNPSPRKSRPAKAHHTVSSSPSSSMPTPIPPPPPVLPAPIPIEHLDQTVRNVELGLIIRCKNFDTQHHHGQDAAQMLLAIDIHLPHMLWEMQRILWDIIDGDRLRTTDIVWTVSEFVRLNCPVRDQWLYDAVQPLVNAYLARIVDSLTDAISIDLAAGRTAPDPMSLRICKVVAKSRYQRRLTMSYANWVCLQ